MHLHSDLAVFRHFLYLCSFVFIILISPSQADSASDFNWTLKRIVKRAIEQTPELKALEADVLVFQNRALQAGRWDNPDFAFNAGPMFSTPNGTSVDLTLNQRIPWFGKRSVEEQIGLQRKRIAESDQKIEELRVRHSVIQLAYRYAAALERSRHITHRRERMQLVSKYLESRPFASPSKWAEKSLVQFRLREVEESFLESIAIRDKIWSNLNVYLDLDKSFIPTLNWFVDPSEPDYSELLNHLTHENPELARQRHLIATADLEIEQASKKGYPELLLGVGYNEQTAGVSQKIYSGTIQLSLPLFDRGGYSRHAAQAQKEAENFRLEQKCRILLNAFAQAKIDLIKSRNRITLYPFSLISSLEVQMRRAEQEWKRGLVPVMAFLEMENQTHLQAERIFDAQTDYVIALSQILLLAGLNFDEGKR